MSNDLKILIVSEHASAKFGGEAVLPLHYYRVLRSRNINVWLLVHERTREELCTLYPNDANIFYVSDTLLHKVLWRISELLPTRLGGFTAGFLMRIATQFAQRPIIKKMIAELGVNVIHQPMPVSPKEPSFIFGFGVPVVIGPMNGGIDYPPAFRHLQGKLEGVALSLGRQSANFLNWIIPGKRKAACLLVANERTRGALPRCLSHVQTKTLVENGVDLALWRNTQNVLIESKSKESVHYVYMGRLVDWKAVDILISAFSVASRKSPMSLEIIGDGPARSSLEDQARSLGILSAVDESSLLGKVQFAGWLTQRECALRLQASDALVLPSLMECGGAVVLEAMGMSVPVIASNWGGPADYLDDSCGVLLNINSKEKFFAQLTDSLVLLAMNEGLRSKMGANGKNKVISQFDWEIKVNSITEIYSKSITNKTGSTK